MIIVLSILLENYTISLRLGIRINLGNIISSKYLKFFIVIIIILYNRLIQREAFESIDIRIIEIIFNNAL